eukprot:4275113-Prymnesium_polylepis.2
MPMYLATATSGLEAPSERIQRRSMASGETASVPLSATSRPRTRGLLVLRIFCPLVFGLAAWHTHPVRQSVRLRREGAVTSPSAPLSSVWPMADVVARGGIGRLR